MQSDAEGSGIVSDERRAAVAAAISGALPAYMQARGALDPSGKPGHWWPEGEGTQALADAALQAADAAGAVGVTVEWLDRQIAEIDDIVRLAGGNDVLTGKWIALRQVRSRITNQQPAAPTSDGATGATTRPVKSYLPHDEKRIREALEDDSI